MTEGDEDRSGNRKDVSLPWRPDPGGANGVGGTQSEGSVPAPAPPEDPRPRPPSIKVSALVFLLGVSAAILVSALLSSYLSIPRESPPSPLLPDPAHLLIVDEEGDVKAEEKEEDLSFGHTQLQRKKPSQVQSYKECEVEALQALQAAINSRGRHGVERAQKLFDHAISICPNHPRVLVFYGEFLEKKKSLTDEELIKADHLFARAIAFSEDDSEERGRALLNRRRTSARVEELDRKALKRIDDKKRAFQRVSEGSSSMRRAKKEAYFQHIYHTVGIEGNSMTLAQTRSVLETKLAVGGKSVVEHNEVLGLDAALRYVNQTLVDKMGEITVQDILEVHRRVVGFADPVEAGMLRRTQVFVGDHVPPQPGHIELLMRRFVEWLNSPHNAELHPVDFAALAHYKLVYIHPFVDGNGRTSRLLMNLILMKSGFPPVIIRKQDRLPYYRHLVTANEGDVRPFIRFVAECTERTLDAYIAAATERSDVGQYRYSSAGLAVFGDDTTIAARDQLEYHEAVVMGGSLGENVTVELET